MKQKGIQICPDCGQLYERVLARCLACEKERVRVYNANRYLHKKQPRLIREDFLNAKVTLPQGQIIFTNNCSLWEIQQLIRYNFDFILVENYEKILKRMLK